MNTSEYSDGSDAQRRDSGYTGERVLEMELPDRRKRGRPQRRFLDVVKEDMQRVGVTEEDASARTYKAYRGGVFTLTRLLIPAWIVHYYVKYHIAQRPYGIVELKPKLFPGDKIMETGEVVPALPETHGHH
uniref:NADH dehydrogenase [ubiquinone] 1 beta subcomplex subunit 6 n=1 Tax=Amphilophus citrinellus TaxID=61819 RepID=A0A3Q0SSR8_AMPCI